MKFAAATLFLCSSLFIAPDAWAQGLQVDLEEFRRLKGEVADLREARAANTERIAELSAKVDKLQAALRQSEERTTMKQGDFITREDLKKIVDRIAEVDSQRERDKKVILDEFDQLAKALSRPPRRERERARENEDRGDDAPAEKIEGEFYPHKVQSGETLGEILQAYNAALKKDGRPAVTFSQVKKVNPKLDLNRIRVGQEILLPVPKK